MLPTFAPTDSMAKKSKAHFHGTGQKNTALELYHPLGPPNSFLFPGKNTVVIFKKNVFEPTIDMSILQVVKKNNIEHMTKHEIDIWKLGFYNN